MVRKHPQPIYELSAYLTTEWLSDVHENQMLDILRSKQTLSCSNRPIIVENVHFVQFILAAYQCRNKTNQYADDRYFLRAREVGQAVAGPESRSSGVGFLVNARGNHWVAVVLEFKHNQFLYGDPLGQDPECQLSDAIGWWTYHHTGQHFHACKLTITPQQDSYSCGVLAFDALAHHCLANSYPLIPAHDATNERARILAEVVARHLDHVSQKFPRNKLNTHC